MSGILKRQQWDPTEAAQLLRALSDELRQAEGVARNGLFLELHRLQDTLFRYTLESHPEAPLELAARAFDRQDSMPAPQVLFELMRLGTPWVTSEMQQRYRHMNAVRNNMAHEAVLERVTISGRNSKTMARLAAEVADALDPERRALPGTAERDEATSPVLAARWLWLTLGLALGLALWGLWQTTNLFGAGVAVVAVMVSIAVWLDSARPNN